MKVSAGRQFKILTIIVFFSYIALSMPYLTIPSLFFDPNYTILANEWQQDNNTLLLGLVLAAYPLGQFFGSPIVGGLADELGRRKVLSITLLLTSICNLLSAVAVYGAFFWLLVLSYFAAGFLEGNLAIARAMATEFKEENKQAAFGKIDAATSLGYIFGPLIGGLLFEWNPAIPFLAVSFLFFSLSLVLGRVEGDHEFIAKSQPSRSMRTRFSQVKKVKELFQNGLLRKVLLTAILFTLAADLFYDFSPVMFTAFSAVRPWHLALYNAVVSLAFTIGSGWAVGWLAKYLSIEKVFINVAILFSLLLIALPFVHNPVFLLLTLGAIGFMIGVGTTNTTTQISDCTADEVQGEVMGLYISLCVLGDALTCLMAGAVVSWAPGLPILGAGALVVCSLACYLKKAGKSAPIPGSSWELSLRQVEE